MSIRIYGKRVIQTPPGQKTRPTSSKVRESVFNIWQHHLQDCRWLDLCCGSGSMGAEALVRGAKEVVGIEKSGTACKVIQQNWKKLATPAQSFKIIRGDIRSVLKSNTLKKFDLIYLDPPYAEFLYVPVLQLLAKQNLLREGGAIAAEHDRAQSLPQNIGCFTVTKTRHYGKTSVTFYSNPK